MSRRRLTALFLAFGLALAACGGSGAEYVQNKPAETYFKVPKDWQARRFAADQLGVAEFLRPGAWGVVVTRDSVDPGEVLTRNPDVPGGIFIIGQLELPAYSQMTPLVLRSVVLPGPDGQDQLQDPIDLYNNEDDRLLISRFDEISYAGLRGYHYRYRLRQEIGTVGTVIERIRLIHDPSHTYYDFQFSCNQRCFGDSQREINEIFDSLRIRKDQP